MIWKMGQSVPSASLQTIQKWEELLTKHDCSAFQRDINRVDNNVMKFKKGEIICIWSRIMPCTHVLLYTKST